MAVQGEVTRKTRAKAKQKTQPVTNEVATVLAESVDKFGRPSKLTPEVIEKAYDYLNRTSSISVNAGGLLPTKERMALELGVSRQTLDNWAANSQDFLDVYNTLHAMQADMLIQNGLVGRYTPAITAIMLSKHDYVKQEKVDNKHEMVQPLLSNIADKDDSNTTPDVIDLT